MRLVDPVVQLDTLLGPGSDESEVREQEYARHLHPGGQWVSHAGRAVPALWGSGDSVAWAEGESLMLAGPTGVGKSTIATQLVAARVGLRREVLGMPVRVDPRGVLVLAMDRPRQLARLYRLAFGEDSWTLLDDRLTIWEGPPPADLARAPGMLLELAQRSGRGTVVVDSLKDAAIPLSDEAVGGGWNRARQGLLTEGIELVELHHLVKRGAGGGRPDSLADVYGSGWLTSGAGSVFIIDGAAGDSLVTLTHVKQPAEVVGPIHAQHDHTRVVSRVAGRPDLLAILARRGGSIAGDLAGEFKETTEPTKADKEATRRTLDGLVAQGLAEQCGTGVRGGKQYTLTDDGRRALDANHPDES